MLGPIAASGTWAKCGQIQFEDMRGPIICVILWDSKWGVGEVGVFVHLYGRDHPFHFYSASALRPKASA